MQSIYTSSWFNFMLNNNSDNYKFTKINVNMMNDQFVMLKYWVSSYIKIYNNVLTELDQKLNITIPTNYLLPKQAIYEFINIAINSYNKNGIKNFIQPSVKQRILLCRSLYNIINPNEICLLSIGNIYFEDDISDLNGIWLHYNSKKDRFHINCSKKKNKCGIDLGLKTFATICDEYNVAQICNDRELYKLVDKYIAKRDKITLHYEENAMKRKNYNKVYERITRKVNNRLEELYFKVATYITNNYKVINVGYITSEELMQNSSNINKKRFEVLKFEKFLEILQKLAGKKRCTVNMVDEYLTTQICCQCGCRNYIADKDIYECNNCNYKASRDINAAINIFNRKIE